MSKREKKEAVSLEEGEEEGYVGKTAIVDEGITVRLEIAQKVLITVEKRRAARREAEEKRQAETAGKKKAETPATGKKEAETPAAGKKEAETPAAGKRKAETPAAGKKEATINVPLKYVLISGLISSLLAKEGNVVCQTNDGKKPHFMAEKCQKDDDGNKFHRIPVYVEDMETLQKVVDFMKLYGNDETKMQEIERPLKSVDLIEVVGQVYAEFIEAANYLQVDPLRDLACAKIASMLKGKTPQQIRDTFDIVNDFSPEEEKELRQQNAWADQG